MRGLLCFRNLLFESVFWDTCFVMIRIETQKRLNERSVEDERILCE